MALNKVEICGLDTSKLPKITQSESRELLSRIKAGDNAAREDFIGANLRLGTQHNTAFFRPWGADGRSVPSRLYRPYKSNR